MIGLPRQHEELSVDRHHRPLNVMESIAPHALTAGEVLALTGTDIRAGLTATDAYRRLSLAGPNRLPRRQSDGLVLKALRNLREPMATAHPSSTNSPRSATPRPSRRPLVSRS